MSTAVVKAGKSSWVGSAKPAAVHETPPRLQASSAASYGFLRARNPVPSGDTVTAASLQVIVASGAGGSVTFTLKRVTQRVTWDELSWNTKPSVTATGSAAVTVSAPVDGTVLTFDVTTLVQTIAGGADNFGWRLEATSAVKVYGYDSPNPPVLTVTSTTVPATPTDLRPAGTGSLAKPHITFTAPDVTGEAEVQSVQVQVSTSSSPTADSAGTWTAPTFDSGEVASTTPNLDLALTAYGGVSSGSTIYWHVRWKSGGVWSAWSDTVAYARLSWTALAVTNPASGVVEEPTPPIIATFTGIRQYRVQIVLASDPTRVIAKSGIVDGAGAGSLSWTVTTPLQDSTNYVALVDVWGSTIRTSSPGDPDYLRATVPFTTTFVGTVTVPTLVSVAADPDLPAPKLTFTRSTAPDSFTILRDGEVVAADLDPADLFVSGTTYAYTDFGSANMRAHTWKVAAVVNGQRSAWSSAATATISPKGVWLVSQDRTLSVCFAGTSLPLARNDQAAVFRVRGATKGTVISVARGFTEGTFAGQIDDYAGRTAFDYYDDFEAIADLNEPVYLIGANASLIVRIWNVAPQPNESIRDGLVILDTSFSFAEVE